LEGIQISYKYLQDYDEEIKTGLKEPWITAFEQVRNGSTDISGGHADGVH
jgi:hypothetical protein